MAELEHLDLCGASISGHVTIDCDNIITPGLEQVGVIFNRSEIEKWVPDGDNDSIIKSITLKGGIKGHVIYQMGSQPFNGTNVAFAEGSVLNTFTNTCSFVILDNGPRVCKDIIDNLANGSFVVLFKNKFAGKDTSTDPEHPKHPGLWQVMGKESGLRASEISCDKYNDETNSGWQITLTEEKATKSAWFFFDTDDATTNAAVQELAGMEW